MGRSNWVSFLLLVIIAVTGIFGAGSTRYCDNQEECGDFMICLNNECLCDEIITSPDFEDYSNQNHNFKASCKRSAQIGEACDNQTTICLNHSVCNSVEICDCPEGLEKTEQTSECRVPYNSPCNETQLCNPEKFLACRRNDDNEDDHRVKGVCRCHDEEQLTFDPSKNSCVGRVGQSCELVKWVGLQLGCDGNSHCFKADPREVFYGVCKCNPGFVQSDTNKCESIYGKPCSPDTACANGFNLECVAATCRCKSGSIFDARAEGCKLIVGAECQEFGDKCVRNSECRVNYESPGPDFKLECQCLEGYLPNFVGECLLGDGDINCSNYDQVCHSDSGRKCLNSSCQCDECIGIHGSPCSMKSNQHNCIQNAVCNEGSKCQCKDTFHVTEEGHCEPSFFGAICSPSGDEDNQDCPSKFGLSCQENPDHYQTGVCSCVDNSTIFDKEANRCLLRLEEHCSPPSQRCLTNAFCGTNKSCQCYSGYSPTPDGNCMLDYLQSCQTATSANKECNLYLGLDCINKTCLCPWPTTYNQTSLKCYNSIGDDGNFTNSNSTALESLGESNSTNQKNSNEDITEEKHPKNPTKPQTPVLSGLMTFTIMAIIVMVVFAVILNTRIQRKYYCLTS